MLNPCVLDAALFLFILFISLMNNIIKGHPHNGFVYVQALHELTFAKPTANLLSSTHDGIQHVLYTVFSKYPYGWVSQIFETIFRQFICDPPPPNEA